MKNRFFRSVSRVAALIAALVVLALLTSALYGPAFAAEGDIAPEPAAAESAVNTGKSDVSAKAAAAGIAVAVAAVAGAISMAIAIRKSVESMARQPEAAGKINSAMMLGLVFIETVIIYALIVAILIIFVL